jgi:hypothetical protein
MPSLTRLIRLEVAVSGSNRYKQSRSLIGFDRMNRPQTNVSGHDSERLSIDFFRFNLNKNPRLGRAFEINFNYI